MKPITASDEAYRFLDPLFSCKRDQDQILIWRPDGKHSAWFTDVAQAAAFVRANSSRDVYCGVALSPKDHGPHQRLKIEGGERLPSGIVGLWADIDVLDGVHKKTNLPPSVEQAMTVLFPELPPSILVHSGGGLQAWWLFKEPWTFESEEEIGRAGALATRWIRALRARAAAKGWDIDSVGDLTRVLRVPGTHNCKIPGQARPVQLIEINERRYNPSDLEEFLDMIGAERTVAPIPSVPLSSNGANGSAAGLVYDPEATYPADKFKALAAAEPRFEASWNHNRRDLKDQTISAHDMALANFAVQAGWTDQEIANLLIAHRRRHNQDLKLRDSYHATTIRTARARFGAHQEADISQAQEPENVLAALRGLNGDKLPGSEVVTSVRDAMNYVKNENGSQVVEMPARTPSAHPVPPKFVLKDFHDVGNAQRLIAYYGADIRWCAAMKRWLVWDGERWALDDMEAVRKRAMHCMVKYLEQAVDAGDSPAQKFARASLDYKRLRDMLEVAKALVPIHPSRLDTDLMALNFQDGTLDLETRELRPHRREDYITKLVHHNYRPDAQCPRFLSFLNRIMGVHPDASETEVQRADRLIAWLQKAFGYSLTGITSEKLIFVCHGRGNNGKTTLLSTFLRLIDEYAALLQIDSLMVRQENNNTQADLADLRGARFAMTSETEDGQRLAEAKLKRITQGMGKIKATRKYENPIEFPETHKLWIDGNHRPRVRGSDNAIWSRLCPIPFTVIIPPEEIDQKLTGKLLEEAEGILAWATVGARRWRQEGLGRPDEIRQARNEWRKDSEPLKDFFDDCCIRKTDAYTHVSLLWETYMGWCGRQRVRDPLTRDQFTTRLEDMGFERKMHRLEKEYPERTWWGIDLR